MELFCAIPLTCAVIGSLFPRPQGLSAHLSAICCTINQDHVFRHTMICKKGYQPLFLASFEGKVFTIERFLGHGCYLSTNASFLFSHCHLQDITIPNGLAVGANTDNKVHLFVTNTCYKKKDSCKTMSLYCH